MKILNKYLAFIFIAFSLGIASNNIELSILDTNSVKKDHYEYYRDKNIRFQIVNVSENALLVPENIIPGINLFFEIYRKENNIYEIYGTTKEFKKDKTVKLKELGSNYYRYIDLNLILCFQKLPPGDYKIIAIFKSLDESCDDGTNVWKGEIRSNPFFVTVKNNNVFKNALYKRPLVMFDNVLYVTELVNNANKFAY